jgi:uncharacterized membrane protein
VDQTIHMTDKLLFVLTLCSALGCGMIAGVFFAFSSFVMKGLSRLPAAEGIAAMQAINIAAVTPLFMFALFGTAAACVLLAVLSLSNWHKPGAACLLIGSLLYLTGSILVTAVFNVPRNNALAATEPAGVDALRLWTAYVSSWTAWNHVRALASLAAAGFLIIALWLSRAGIGVR